MEKAEMRRVLIVPGPVFKIPADTVHPLAVRPAALTTDPAVGLGAAMAESYFMSPWNPIKFRFALILVDVTG